MRKVFIILLSCVLSFGSCAIFAADDIRFETSVDSKSVALGSSLQLNLNFYGTQNISAPQLPQIDGFQSRYLGPSSRFSMINASVSTSVTHMYQLIPLKTGSFTIPSLSITYKGKTYSSQPIEVEVVKGQLTQSQQNEGAYSVSEGELKDDIFIELSTDKKIAYINELIPVTVKLYVHNLAVRDVQYPQLTHEGFVMEPFSKYQQYRETKNGVNFDVVEFKTTGYATRSGELTLGPAQQECTLLIQQSGRRNPRSFFDDFDSFFNSGFDNLFGRYEQYPLRLESEPSALAIKDLPQAAPADFNGAVGDYSFVLSASPAKVAVGDPITLKMTISGSGNFTTVSQPAADLSANFKVYDPQIKQTEGAKSFEQVIIPKSAAVKEIPQMRFSFFNPLNEKYQTLAQGPIALSVEKSTEQAAKIVSGRDNLEGAAAQPETLGKDIIFIKDRLGSLKKQNAYLYRSFVFRVAHILPLCLVGLIAFMHGRSQRLKHDLRYARRLRAPRQAKLGMQKAFELLKEKKAREFFDTVSKTLYQYLGDRFHLSAGAVTAESVAAILKEKNVSEDYRAKLKNIFEQCDMARFSPQEFSYADMENIFHTMQELIDELERTKV